MIHHNKTIQISTNLQYIGWSSYIHSQNFSTNAQKEKINHQVLPIKLSY